MGVKQALFLLSRTQGSVLHEKLKKNLNPSLQKGAKEKGGKNKGPIVYEKGKKKFKRKGSKNRQRKRETDSLQGLKGGGTNLLYDGYRRKRPASRPF